MNWGSKLYNQKEISKMLNRETEPERILSIIESAKKNYINLYKIISENPDEFNRTKTNMELLYRVSRLKAKKMGIDISKIPPSLKIENFLKEKK